MERSYVVAENIAQAMADGNVAFIVSDLEPPEADEDTAEEGPVSFVVVNPYNERYRVTVEKV